MKRTITYTYTYEWWRIDEGEIKPEHVDALEESAINQLRKMDFTHGSTCGELFDNIHMTEDDPDEGISYQGWWSKEEKL